MSGIAGVKNFERICISKCENVRDSFFLPAGLHHGNTYGGGPHTSMCQNIAKEIMTEANPGEFSMFIKKSVVETAQSGELRVHLGYYEHDARVNGSGSILNGKSSKQLRGDHGDRDIKTPRDREGTFELMIVKKGQSRLTQIDVQILSLYAKGMSTRDNCVFRSKT